MAKKSSKTDRVSNREWKKSLHTTGASDDNNGPVSDEVDGTTYYTFIGQHDELDEKNRPLLIRDPEFTKQEWEDRNEEWLLAKKIKLGNRQRYYVKIDQNGDLYNPLGLFTHKNDRIFTRKKDLERQKLISVNKDMFNCYVRFLSTKNVAWLSQAKQAN